MVRVQFGEPISTNVETRKKSEMIITVPAYVAEKLDGLRKIDFHIQFYKGSGPGGQHRNKRETACRITHRLTGVSAYSSVWKSQAKNKDEAFHRLVPKLVAHYRLQMPTVEVDVSKTIKTYNEKRNTVKDHRTGKTGNYKKVLDGEIDLLLGE